MKEKVTTTKYEKRKILKASRYADRKDLLQAILLENRVYSFKEVDSEIEKFMKGRIK